MTAQLRLSKLKPQVKSISVAAFSQRIDAGIIV
jgi:hypothetical protein